MRVHMDLDMYLGLRKGRVEHDDVACSKFSTKIKVATVFGSRRQREITREILGGVAEILFGFPPMEVRYTQFSPLGRFQILKIGSVLDGARPCSKASWFDTGRRTGW